MNSPPVYPHMTQYDADCTTHKATNGRHYLSFVVDGTAGAPDEFELQPSPLEYERLKEHSAGDGVGQVPAVYDDSWAIDWAALETASDD